MDGTALKILEEETLQFFEYETTQTAPSAIPRTPLSPLGKSLLGAAVSVMAPNKTLVK